VSWAHLAGLIVLPGAVDVDYAHAARRAGLPVVFVGHDPADGLCSSVLADNRAGVREAVAHLIGHGHRRIAFAGHLTHFDLRERHEGYREELLAHGLTPQPELLFETGDNHETGGEVVADALVRAGMPATAIVLGTDRNAVGLIERLRAAGYDLPRELAVVGFDDIADATYERPSLSTVRQPLDRVGAAVYELIGDLAAGQTKTAEVRHVPTTFVQRDSCGCPSIGLPVSEQQTRELFAQVQYLQATLNIQYELGIELLGAHERDPRNLAWLESTPAVGGALGIWAEGDDRLEEDRLEIVGEYPIDPAAGPATTVPVSRFPPAGLFDLADGPAGDIVFVVPVRSASRDWGLLAAVGRIQASTPPGREMMNQSGSLLAAALDRGAMVATLREKEESLRAAALHDHLTGLPNRVLLADRLHQAGLRAARQPGYRFAVLLLDLNRFKAVNDSLGHAAGDQLLVEVARRLTALLRKSDTVARLGGDEFVVLLDGIAAPGPQQPDTDPDQSHPGQPHPGQPDPEQPDPEQVVRDGITAAITAPFLIDGREVEVGVSIGVALSTAGSTDPDQLLREADAAMYRAKPVARPRQ
jgi:GGDEF domain-containing protein